MSREESIDEAIEVFGDELNRIVSKHFEGFTKPVIKNIRVIVIAILLFLRAARVWYGRMTLSGLSRCMNTEGSAKSKYKRLDRFLLQKPFEIPEVAKAFLRMIPYEKIGGLVPVLIDQTDVQGVQVIAASIPSQGRALPLAFKTFEYETINFSQNKIEKDFFISLQESIGKEASLVFVMDRGYASSDFIKHFKKAKQLYVIRACGNVTVELCLGGKQQKIGLGRLPYKQGKAKRYRNVLYHSKEKLLVDIVIYKEKGFKEPWFIIIPSGCEDVLAFELVVKLYRSRMNIEVKFRDLKSSLGLRGLKFKVMRTEKLARLLLCISIAYLILVLLGSCDLALQMRLYIEIKRGKPRHGTDKTLSVLSVALYMACDSYLLNLSNLMSLLTNIISSLLHL